MTKGRPLIADNDRDRCEAITILTEWKRRSKIADLRCGFFVKVAVGGKRLCYRHALMEALAILVNEKRATPLISPPQRGYILNAEGRKLPAAAADTLPAPSYRAPNTARAEADADSGTSAQQSAPSAPASLTPDFARACKVARFWDQWSHEECKLMAEAFLASYADWEEVGRCLAASVAASGPRTSRGKKRQ